MSSSMTTYYHVSTLPLVTGNVIAPGNWGRIINCYSAQNGNPWMMARELAFELVRATEFPDRPGRFSSAFLFETSDAAQKHRSEQTPWGMIYEVELSDPQALTFRAAYNLTPYPPPQTAHLPVFVQNARAYWAGEEITTPEILTKSPLRVTGFLSTGPWSYQP